MHVIAVFIARANGGENQTETANVMKSNKVVSSNCEKDFILSCIRGGKRLDGRQTYDYRRIEISFGIDHGHCEVQLGKTRVLAQVSCEVVCPPANRPAEGQLFFNLELSPMASPEYEAGRLSDQAIELNRLLERVYKQSQCVDVESLCIVAGEKVWSIRVDVTVLDDGGNVIDCASIATITALSHFRRPDVSVVGEQVTIHSAEDREPVPLSVHHIPVYVTFAFFDNGNLLLVDPTEKEESVMDGEMLIAMNMHRELCGVQMNGGLSLEVEQVIRCSKISAVKVTEITELIQKALKMDTEARKSGKLHATGITQDAQRVTVTTAEETCMDVTETVQAIHLSEIEAETEDSTDTETILRIKGQNTAEIGLGGWNTWLDDDEMQEQDDGMGQSPKQEIGDKVAGDGESSEEEEKVMLLSSTTADFEVRKVKQENNVQEGNENEPSPRETKQKRKKKKKKRTS